MTFHAWRLTFSLLFASTGDCWVEVHLASLASPVHISAAPSTLVYAQHLFERLETLFAVDLPHLPGIAANTKNHLSTWTECARFVPVLAILIDSAT